MTPHDAIYDLLHTPPRAANLRAAGLNPAEWHSHPADVREAELRAAEQEDDGTPPDAYRLTPVTPPAPDAFEARYRAAGMRELEEMRAALDADPPASFRQLSDAELGDDPPNPYSPEALARLRKEQS